MKNKPMLLNLRDHERGAVAIVVAFTWTALFGVAVLAIDFGYLYAKRRGLQTAADGLLKLSMPDWVRLYPSGLSQANSDATNTTNVQAFNVSASEVSTSQDMIANTFTVTVRRRYPTFIGGLFGMNGKTVSASATGKKAASGTGAAVLALGGAATLGVKINGDTDLTINGDVTSNGPLDYCGGATRTYTTNGNIQASALTPGAPSVCTAPAPPIPGWATWDIVTGTVNAVGMPFADPFAGVPPPCTAGTMFSPFTMPALNPGPACPTGACYIPAGVYCANGLITLTPSDPCNCIETDPAGGGVTFVTSGPIVVGGSGGVYLKAWNNLIQNPNKIIFWTTSNASPAFNFGGCGMLGCGAIQFDGAIYAPAGRINIGSQDPMTMNGSIVGWEVNLGLGTAGPFTITGNGGGGGGPSWSLFR